MTNQYYTPSGAPASASRGQSANVRAEYGLVQAGFDTLPSPSALWGASQNYALDTGAANALVVTGLAASYLTSYFDGMTLRVKAAASNTATTTVNVNGLGAKAIFRYDGTTLAAGDIVAGQVIEITYVAAVGYFQLARVATSTAVGPAGPSTYSGRTTIAGTYTLLVTDQGKMFEATADTALTITVAGLGSSFSCWIAAGTSTITVSASDGVTNWKMYAGEVRFFYSDGATMRSKVLQRFRLTPTVSFSFVEPPGYAGYDVFIQAPGGGGGSGRRNTSSAFAGGGSGGGGGAWVQGVVLAVTAGNSIAVTVGAPGTGAAAPTVDSTNGNTGTAGGNSSFGTALIATGGTAGGGGTISTSGAAGTAVVSMAPVTMAGGAGALGSNGSTNANNAPSLNTWGASGGGGGGGVSSSNTTTAPSNGGIGGTDSPTNQLAGGAAGTVGVGGTGNISAAISRRGGTGGGGGIANVSGGGFAGGAGVRGGGGGGAGGGLNGFTGGAGGNGGAGYMEIVGLA